MSKEKRSLKAPKDLVELIKRLKKGDKNALEPIIRQTHERVYRFCFHLTQKEERATELCQEVYLKAIEPLAQLDDPSGIYPWLFRIAKNTHIDRVRLAESKVEKSQDHDSDTNPRLSLIASTSNPDIDNQLDVRDALNKMDPESRSLLYMAEYEGYSYAEIGQTLGITEDAVRSRLKRVRKSFLAMFGPNDSNDDENDEGVA